MQWKKKKKEKKKEKPPDKLCHLLRIVLEMETCEMRAEEASHNYLLGGEGVSLLFFSHVWLLMQEICGFTFSSLTEHYKLGGFDALGTANK